MFSNVSTSALCKAFSTLVVHLAQKFLIVCMILGLTPFSTARSGRRGRWFESSHLDYCAESGKNLCETGEVREKNQ